MIQASSSNIQASYIFQDSSTINAEFVADYFLNVIDQKFQRNLYDLDPSLRYMSLSLTGFSSV